MRWGMAWPLSSTVRAAWLHGSQTATSCARHAPLACSSCNCRLCRPIASGYSSRCWLASLARQQLSVSSETVEQCEPGLMWKAAAEVAPRRAVAQQHVCHAAGHGSAHRRLAGSAAGGWLQQGLPGDPPVPDQDGHGPCCAPCAAGCGRLSCQAPACSAACQACWRKPTVSCAHCCQHQACSLGSC